MSWVSRSNIQLDMDEVHLEEGGTVVKVCKKRNVSATADKKSDSGNHPMGIAP
jgi:hypothetical protein